jgi:hypothetical protein
LLRIYNWFWSKFENKIFQTNQNNLTHRLRYRLNVNNLHKFSNVCVTWVFSISIPCDIQLLTILAFNFAISARRRSVVKLSVLNSLK